MKFGNQLTSLLYSVITNEVERLGVVNKSNSFIMDQQFLIHLYRDEKVQQIKSNSRRAHNLTVQTWNSLSKLASIDKRFFNFLKRNESSISLHREWGDIERNLFPSGISTETPATEIQTHRPNVSELSSFVRYSNEVWEPTHLIIV